MKCQIAGMLLGSFLCVSIGSAELLSERKRESDQPILPLGFRSYADTFKENKRALIVVSGRGRSCLGLYVHDEHGNCVAKDDLTSPRTSDDLAADWIPIATALHDVTVVNAGLELNRFELAIR